MDHNISRQSTLNNRVGKGTIAKSDGAISYIDDTISDYSTTRMVGFEILTANSTPREQEFLVYDAAASAPNPTTYALLGLGFIIIGAGRTFFNKRKTNQTANSAQPCAQIAVNAIHFNGTIFGTSCPRD